MLVHFIIYKTIHPHTCHILFLSHHNYSQVNILSHLTTFNTFQGVIQASTIKLQQTILGSNEQNQFFVEITNYQIVINQIFMQWYHM